MLGATLKSRIVETKTFNGPTEGGFYEIEVHFDPATLDVAVSPRDIINQLIAACLIEGMRETGLPKEMWDCYFEPVLQKEFNFPLVCNMGGVL